MDEVAAGDDLIGLFAQLFDARARRQTEPHPTLTTADGSGLYADDISYLEDALRAAFVDPTAAAEQPRRGLATRHRASGRPSWSRRRTSSSGSRCCRRPTWPSGKVTSKLVLATTPAAGQGPAGRGAARRHRPRAGPTRTTSVRSTRCWTGRPTGPSPSSDRNEVFAVRGDVDDPTVLLLGTLTNRRGQVVAASWLTVEFPDPGEPVVRLGRPRTARPARRWPRSAGTTTRPNPGPVGDLDALQALIPPAVRQGAGPRCGMSSTPPEATSPAASSDWSHRLEAWDDEADALIQRQSSCDSGGSASVRNASWSRR